jgi:hypothetical protein
MKGDAMDTNDWQNSTGQNVYEMFVENDEPDFWVRRITWGGTCARVIRVGEMTKPGPYFGSPSVLMDVYSLDGNLKEGLAQLPVPGTYKTWRKYHAPPWANHINLRPLDDPAIDVAMDALDRKRGKGKRQPAQDEREVARIRLTVPFARKDEAKRIGARWSPTERMWWLPAHDTSALSKAQSLGFLSSGD